MYFLFSGEGATDLGLCAGGAQMCEGSEYDHGPMTVIADQVVKSQHHYSFLETGHCGFVARQVLVKEASELKAVKKSLRLPGKRRAKETRYFFNNARAFARIANQRQEKLTDDVVAVLFCDSDAASAGRGHWEEKRQSMLDGFQEEAFERGVPMIPKPTSEAWLLCALKERSYDDCAALEDRSGKSNTPNSLKRDLEQMFGHAPTREELCDAVARGFDIDRIEMPSFAAFRRRLEEVI